MAKEGIQYGWHRQQFKLHAIEVMRTIQLQEKNDSGDWVERAIRRLMFMTGERRKNGEAKFDRPGELRYVRKRQLLATARVAYFMSRIRLRTSENGDTSAPSDPPIDEIRLSIEEFDMDDLEVDTRELIDAGRLVVLCNEQGFLTSCVPSRTFDLIESAVKGGESITATFNIKGWHWIVEDSVDTFIDPEEPSRAELVSFTARLTRRNEDEEDSERAASPRPPSDDETRIGELQLKYENLEDTYHLHISAALGVALYLGTDNWLLAAAVGVGLYAVSRKFAKKPFTKGV